MKLQAQFVGCGNLRGERPEHWPEHPMVSERPGGPCEICALLRTIDSDRSVMTEVLETLLAGKVVLAADGIRGWLAASATLRRSDTEGGAE